MLELMMYIGSLVIFVGLIVCYLANIYKLIKSKEVTGMVLARVCGIFIFPIGVLLGLA
ncbi:hypothetical protein UFOVP139_16 [uncultured Caudovirales phage]|uniref:Uncharacterized protein n=1 Tax=uncultured Caudovirales phage TaxID=2100421 RepID=A0A6J5LDB2_9CAUD|nr:hypothetical protein UFOVP139_16 [uncultured Caudovirales phage]